MYKVVAKPDYEIEAKRSKVKKPTFDHLRFHKISTKNLPKISKSIACLLYTSDAADDMQCVDLGGRRIIKKG